MTEAEMKAWDEAFRLVLSEYREASNWEGFDFVNEWMWDVFNMWCECYAYTLRDAP